ncbi:membrane protein insertase YidC [Nocardia jejuensis]|uniref:membrane protein insertase YidC n=1 Tax=Nocardia jejuensis TaxID=328049 RepID=UPI00082ED96C|nr:membrane protein insertase YidC [Nocardia jejuensis]
MLDFIYYPVSAVLWLWHTAFASVPGASSGLAWVLAIVLLVITLRALLLRPFLAQLRFQRTMSRLAPQIKELQRKHAGDKQKQAAEVQRLQRENGVNLLLGCLPIVGQSLVFLGLFHVLRSFQNAQTANYVFGPDQVHSFLQATLFGAPIGATLSSAGDAFGAVAAVAIPLMIIAAVATHFTARYSIARQRELGVEPTAQTNIMNMMSLWVFPIGVIVSGAIFPVAILLYFVTQNAWTYVQQHVVYRRLDAEDAAKAPVAQPVTRGGTKPVPGAKPVSDKLAVTKAATTKAAAKKAAAKKAATKKAAATKPAVSSASRRSRGR